MWLSLPYSVVTHFGAFGTPLPGTPLRDGWCGGQLGS